MIRKIEKQLGSLKPATWEASLRSLIGFNRKEELKSLSKPCLVIAGEHDKNAPVDTMRKMHNSIPFSTFHEIKDIGHMIHMEAPEVINGILEKFLRALKMDDPIFPKNEWCLTNEQEELCNLAKDLGFKKFSKRAFKYDREGAFPVENYRDLADRGLLGICVPKKYGGLGADLKSYMLAATEIGRYCGATALTFNMHVSSCLWTSFLIDDLKLDEEIRSEHEQLRSAHYKRIIQDRKIYAQPFSEGGLQPQALKLLELML